jgi:hypothetical protein
MSIKLDRWIVTLATMLLVALSLLLNLPARVSAAPATDSSSNSCFTCHEDLYYLHDMGKYYCLTEHADRCVNCHQGDPTVMNEAASHQGLIAYPQQEDGQKCSQCHPQDAQAHLDTFASLAGYKTVIKASPYTPAVQPSSAFPAVSQTNPLFESLPWLAGGIVLFGLWLVLVLSSPLKP